MAGPGPPGWENFITVRRAIHRILSRRLPPRRRDFLGRAGVAWPWPADDNQAPCSASHYLCPKGGIMNIARWFSVVLAFGCLTAAGFAASEASAGDKSSARGDQMAEQEETYNAHRSYTKLHFDDVEMDFGLQWVLGSTCFGGCEIGEAFYVVGGVKEGDTADWQNEWEKMAKSLEGRAEGHLKAGHKASARAGFLRASNYYRTALVSVMPDDPKFKRLGDKCREVFKKAAKLFDPPMEYFELPFEGTMLPGYYLKADGSGRKRKTLIMIGGGETFTEELYFYIAPAAIAHGYNFITLDIPGQGMLPLEGKFFRKDPEVALKLVVDYALGQPEVDPARLAVYGISGGGYNVPRLAIVDKRVKAIVVNSAVTDQYALFSKMPDAKATPEELKKWSPFKRATAGVVSWRWGLEPADIIGLAGANQGWSYDPAKVTCPALIIIGEGEYANEESKRQQHAFLDALPNPKKKLVVTELKAGASSHCLGENRTYMSWLVFNWLDEIFDH